MDHLNIFRSNGFDWPFSLAEFENIVDFSGMLPREQESAVFLMRAWPDLGSNRDFEFLDLNPTLPRVLGNRLEDASPCPTNSPWRAAPPTQTGSARLMIRYVVDGEVKGRLAETVELMRCILWCDNMFKAYDADATVPRPSTIDPLDTYDLISNLAGNAWSGFQYAAIKISLVATAGTFMQDPTQSAHPQEVDENDSVAASDSSSTESDSDSD